MSYEYQIKDGNISFEDALKKLKNKFANKILIGAINNGDPQCISEIIHRLRNIGITVGRYEVSRSEYENYIERAQYEERYPNYYRDCLTEKSLEHFLCFNFTNPKEEDTIIDIAIEHSPVPEIFSRLSGCMSFSQDIMYKPGIHGNRIGSDASEIPVPDNYFTAAIATCSIEHFEGESDIKFIKEMERILIPGGKIVVAPLYLYTRESCQTDPRYAILGNVQFDEDADIYCARDWCNRHGRFYSPESLQKRLIEPNPNLRFKVYAIDNLESISDSVYCRFILVGIKV